MDRQRSTHAIILELLSAAPAALPVAAIIQAAAVLGVSAGNVRVALARLKQRRLVSGAERGFYRLGPAAQPIQREVQAWRNVEARLAPWTGGWIAVYSGAVPRSDRAAALRRDRALLLLGLRELSPGLHVRPDNLAGGVKSVRARLGELGLDVREPVFRIDALDDALQQRALGLWDARALERRYRSLTARLRDEALRLPQRSTRRGARDAFLLGSDAIHVIVTDPLLPPPIVDAAARAELVAEMRRFDQLGRALWRRLFDQDEVSHA